jgi:hypothetical protein
LNHAVKNAKVTMEKVCIADCAALRQNGGRYENMDCTARGFSVFADLGMDPAQSGKLSPSIR